MRQCASKLEDIRQDHTSENTWSIWRKFLLTLCTQDRKIDTQGYNNSIDKKIRQHEIGTKITKYWNGIPYEGAVTNNNGKY
jgi:hypothetical protein